MASFTTNPALRRKEFVDVIINSVNRNNYTGTNSNNFVLNLASPISGQILRYGLKSICFPNLLQTIPTNSSINIISSNGPSVITLTSGNYTDITLATMLQNQLNLLSIDNFLVTIVNTKYVITSDFAGFVINPNALPSTILSKLGFGYANTVVSILGVATAYSPFNLSKPNYLCVEILPLKKRIQNGLNNKYNFIFTVNCAYGDIIYFNSQNTYLQEHQAFDDVTTFNVNKFFVKITDEYGNLVNNQNADWELLLGLEVLGNPLN